MGRRRRILELVIIQAVFQMCIFANNRIDPCIFQRVKAVYISETKNSKDFLPTIEDFYTHPFNQIKINNTNEINELISLLLNCEHATIRSNTSDMLIKGAVVYNDSNKLHLSWANLNPDKCNISIIIETRTFFTFSLFNPLWIIHSNEDNRDYLFLNNSYYIVTDELNKLISKFLHSQN